MNDVLIRTGEKTDTHTEGSLPCEDRHSPTERTHVTMEAEIGMLPSTSQGMPRIISKHLKLGDRYRIDSSSEAKKESTLLIP